MPLSKLKSNLTKCKTAGTGVLKRVQVAVCDKRYAERNHDTMKYQILLQEMMTVPKRIVAKLEDETLRIRTIAKTWNT